ncbi:MAG: hypothetical protein WCC89_21450 [Candidatus Sulfotelmatobacter sp.]|jgi:hypothetical protein
MKAKKPKTRIKDDPIPNPLVVDEEEFTEVVRRMATAEPVKLEEVRGYRRKKNPETDPAKLAMVFPKAPPMKLNRKQWEQVRLTDEANQDLRAKNKG